MAITNRFIGLLAIGIIPLGVSSLLHGSMTLFLLYNALCGCLLLWDFRESRDGEALRIERTGEDVLSLFEQEAIRFQVTNPSHRRLAFELKDETPDFHFKFSARGFSGVLEPNERQEFTYQVEPVKRGAFTFGNVHIRYMGKLGLCQRTFQLPLNREYRVYPNLKNLRKYRLSLCNNRMFKEARRNQRSLGKGTSFESLREYVSGDDYRRINWTASARGDRPIVNQYEPEKNQHVHMLIDTGRPMSYTVKGLRKLDLVVNTALVLSDIVNQGGDLSGLMLFNERVQNVILPAKGADHRNKMLEALYHIEHTNRTSSYEEAFYTLRNKERHRSILFLFTDFDTPEDAEYILKVMPVIRRNHVVVLILIRSEGIEALGSSVVDSQDALFRKGVALELLEERRRVIHLLNRQGVLCMECAPEQLETEAINRYVEIKNRMMV